MGLRLGHLHFQPFLHQINIYRNKGGCYLVHKTKLQNIKKSLIHPNMEMKHPKHLDSIPMQFLYETSHCHLEILFYSQILFHKRHVFLSSDSDLHFLLAPFYFWGKVPDLVSLAVATKFGNPPGAPPHTSQPYPG